MIQLNKKVLVVVAAVILILAGIAIYFVFFAGKIQQKYSVVYLTSGELYVGKLSYFPTLTLTDTYLLQSVKQENQPVNFQLAPLSEAMWSPEKLYINRNQVLFTAKISPNSKVGKAIQDKLNK